MTAALVLEPRERTRVRSLSTVRPEPVVISKARLGDSEALVELLDEVVSDVYGKAFSLTRQARAAERITDKVVARLPRILRSQRWSSVESLRAALVSAAGDEFAAQQRRLSLAASGRELRAWTRHLVLASTAIATAVYAASQVI